MQSAVLRKAKEIPHDPTNRCLEKIWQNSVPTHNKNFRNLGVQGNFQDSIEDIYKKKIPTASLILHSERLTAFFQNLGNMCIYSHHFYLKQILKLLFSCNTIVCIKNPKKPTKKPFVSDNSVL